MTSEEAGAGCPRCVEGKFHLEKVIFILGTTVVASKFGIEDRCLIIIILLDEEELMLASKLLVRDRGMSTIRLACEDN